jgi:hypothetical protein
VATDPDLLILELLDENEALIYSEPARILSWNAEEGEHWRAVEAVVTSHHLRLVRLKKKKLNRGWGIEYDVAVRLRDITDIDVTTSRAGREGRIRMTLSYTGGGDVIEKVDGPEARELLAVLEAEVEQHRLARAGKASLAEQLEKLAALKQSGILSEQDWERAKDLFLGAPRPKQQEAVKMLKSIYDLHKAGVLSEGEFNMKKWDILSRP